MTYVQNLKLNLKRVSNTLKKMDGMTVTQDLLFSFKFSAYRGQSVLLNAIDLIQYIQL